MRIRAALFAVLFLALVLGALLVPVEAWSQVLMEASYWQGPRGIVFFVSLYVIWNFVFPPAPLQMLAGLHYGLFAGLVVIVIGTTVANVISHAVARVLGRTWVAKRAEENDRLHALEQAVGRMGWKAVILLRLSNLIPSNLANLLMGVTPLRLPTILWASLVGSLPGWALMLALGHGGSILIAAEEQTPTHWIVYLGSAAVAIVLLAAIGRRAQKILEAKSEQVDDAAEDEVSDEETSGAEDPSRTSPTGEEVQ